ncbi:MAG: HlyD family efflux transporter periplasmic adaptor subunit [Gammaproteobacteria bacterium]|nr:MAG: HlyD family efflux transporter periplasmic adaptor subunit [Gammaproteobacteria bacterium]
MDIERKDLKRRNTRRRWLIGIAAGALALAAVAGVGLLGPALPLVDRNSVWIDTVKRGQMLREVRGQGVLSPKEIRWITAQTAATVERIGIKPGAVVAADTVLMELGSPAATEELESAGAALAAARADAAAKRMGLENQLLDEKSRVAQIRSAYALARAKVDATEGLANQGIIPALTFREYQLDAEQQQALLGLAADRVAKSGQTLVAQIAADEARIRQLETAYASRARLAEALHVKAGTTGVLQSVAVQEGQEVAAGANLARIARPGELRAELEVAETQAKDVGVGQRVTIDMRTALLAGRVERIDPAVQRGSVQVDVELLGPLPPGSRPDLSVDGTIEIELVPNAVYVARPAIARPDSQLRLFRLSADGKSAERVPVRFGRASVALIEVLEGLAPGDRVLLSDTSVWDKYDRIRLR